MSCALLIIDMINNLDFSGGEKLRQETMRISDNIIRIKEMFKIKKLPVIYINDNFGKWKSSWEEVFDHCSSDESLGKDIALKLRPQEDDYFVLKPKHSGFYNTHLDVLLSDLSIKKLVVTGIAGNICVLFTVNDAYMRGYQIHVPQDAIASTSPELNQFALDQFKEVFGINTEPLVHFHQISLRDD